MRIVIGESGIGGLSLGFRLGRLGVWVVVFVWIYWEVYLVIFIGD